MITLIYPYRNRSLNRVKKSLDSLKNQINNDFYVKFIDYGSNRVIASKIKNLVESYSFCEYIYSYNINQLWNKSRALNIAIKQLKSSYCFVADVDMIFHPEFIEVLNKEKQQDKVTYFQVGFLSELESIKTLPFQDYKIKFTSSKGATGLSLFPVKPLQEVNGFDEFYHLWGAEDTDVHMRLKNNGLAIEFYNKRILMLHQYHKIYRSLDDKRITDKITIKNIAKINIDYYNTADKFGKTLANDDGVWGVKQNKQDYVALLNPSLRETISLNKKKFNQWLKNLNHLSLNKVVLYEFMGTNSRFHNLISRLSGKYTLKEASDLLLLNHIEHLRNKKYLYSISNDLKKISYTLCQE